MYRRNKVIAIESIVVMFVLILLSFFIFLIISSGTNAYEKIIDQKENTESSRVAYSYVSMKIKQNDSASNIDVVDTEYGKTLKINTYYGFCTYIFFSDGVLYECLTKEDWLPEKDTANKITNIDGFDISLDGRYVNIQCYNESGGIFKSTSGTVGLRT